jgi:Ser/Thr protein kinase RdoA (MazF antagonist)
MLNSGDPDLLTIQAVLAHFGLGAAKAVSRTQLGMANRSFHVITADGNRYIAKFLVHQLQSLLINELAIQQQLQDQGIVTPRYIQSSDGECVYRPAAVPELAAVISTSIVGVHPKTVSRGLAYAMGAMLAHYHAAVCSLPVAHTGWLNRSTATQAAVETQNSAVKEAALALIAQGEPLFESGAPCGIIHGDFHIGNLLVTSRTSAKIAAMLDFEEAEENLLLIDIAFGLFGSHSLAYSARHTHTVLHAFLDGYESVRPLDPMERHNVAAAVSYVAGACSLWMYAHGYTANAAHNLAIADALRKIDLSR